MKKWIGVGLALCILGQLVGCGGGLPDESTISLDKKGKVTATIVESFEADYYDAEELESEITEELAEYNQNYAVDHVTVKDFEVKDGVAKLQLEYGSAEYYADYNGITFFAGTVAEAEDAGYDLSGEYVDADGSQMDLDTLTAENDDLKVLILEEAGLAETPEKILAISSGSTASITGKKQARIEEAQLTYILYQ